MENTTALEDFTYRDDTEIFTYEASVSQVLRDENISIAIEVAKGVYEWSKPFVSRPARLVTSDIYEVYLEDGRTVRADAVDLEIKENN